MLPAWIDDICSAGLGIWQRFLLRMNGNIHRTEKKKCIQYIHSNGRSNKNSSTERIKEKSIERCHSFRNSRRPFAKKTWWFSSFSSAIETQPSIQDVPSDYMVSLLWKEIRLIKFKLHSEIRTLCTELLITIDIVYCIYSHT